ncbi:MAG: LLM class flavin-dependent oxidoreductase, partial [Chloroflexi bacterium]|nr:LLM class flavin-dependent oxidoreductase [Chloroflexota bacterium]
PVRAAEDIAMVDLLSGGRFMFGFGRGYQSIEFHGFNVPLDEARERTDEAIEIMRQAWSNKPLTYRGKYWTFENLNVLPKPLQKPHPPLCVAAVSPETVGHYAANGIPFIADSAATFSRCKRAIDEWRRVATEHGHPTENAGLTIQRGLVIAETEAEARAQAAHARDFQKSQKNVNLEGAPIERTGEFAASYTYWKDRYLGKNKEVDTDFMWERMLVAGDPDRVRKNIELLEEMGFRHVLFTLGHAPFTPIEENKRRLELFAKYVMPHFRKKPVAAKGHR